MRRIAVGALLLLGLLLVAVAALWLWRMTLAERGLQHWLQTRGLEGSVRIVRLDLAGLELQHMVLGRQRASRIALGYDPLDLLRLGRVTRVEIEGLRLFADLTAEQPMGNLLDALLGPDQEPQAGADTALPELPPIVLRDAELDLVTGQGPLRLRLAGQFGPAIEGGPSGVMPFDLGIETLDGPLRLDGRASGLYQPGPGDGSSFALALATADGPPLAVSARGTIAEGSLTLGLDLTGSASVLADLAPIPADLRPVRGELALSATIHGPAAPLLAGDASVLVADIAALEALDLSLTLSDLDLPAHGYGIALDAGLILDPDRRLLVKPATLSAAAIDPDWLQTLGLPAPAARLLADGGHLSLHAPGIAPVVLTLDQDRLSAQIDLAADLFLHAGGSLATTLHGGLQMAPAQTAPGNGGLLKRLSGNLAGTLELADLDATGFARLDRLGTAFSIKIAGEDIHLVLTEPLEVRGLKLAETLIAPIAADWQPLLARPIDGDFGSARVQADALPDDTLPDDTLPDDALAGVRLRDDGLHLDLPDMLRLSAGDAVVAAALDGMVRLSRDAMLQDSRVEVSALTASRLPTAFGLLREMSLSGRFAGVPAAAAGALRGTLALDDLAAGGGRIGDLSVALAAHLAWDDQGLVLDLSEPGSLRLSRPTQALAGYLPAAELGIAAATLTATPAGLDLSARAMLPATPFDSAGAGRVAGGSLSAGDLQLDLALGADGIPRGTLRGSALGAMLSDPALAVSNGKVEVRIDGDSVDLDLTGAELRSTAMPPLFPPLMLSGTAGLAGDALSYRARARGLAGALRDRLSITASGGFDLARNRGTAAVALAPLAFQPGLLQPGDLSAALAEMRNVTGSLSGQAELRLGDGLAGSGRIELDGIGFATTGGTIDGLTLSLALSALDPPASPPGQPFSIARVDVGVPLTGIAGSLRLQPEPTGPVLVVERAGASFLGGRLELEDARLDPVASRYDLVLQFQAVDMQQMFALADLEELSGTGSLSGALPVRVEGSAITIQAGRLDALSPGVIAFRSEAGRTALAEGGETVDLMMQALEDFHYQDLGLSLTKPPEGDSEVSLRLVGANPAVMDGQPFIFNINLVSNAAPLLSALMQGTEISDRLLGSVLRRQAP